MSLRVVLFPLVFAAVQLTCGSVGFADPTAVANDRALNSAIEGFDFAVTKTIGELLKQPDTAQVRSAMLTEQRQLKAGFERIANMRPAELSLLDEQLATAFQSYKVEVSRRYDASYLESEMRLNVKQSLLEASRIFRQFENTCVGTTDLDRRADVRVDLKSDDVGDTEAKIQLSGAKRELAAFAQSVAPYFWGTTMAVAVVKVFMFEQEKINAENRLVEGKLASFIDTSDQRAVTERQRSHCRSISKNLTSIRLILDAAIRDPNQIEAMAASIPDVDRELQMVRSTMTRRATAKRALEVATDNRKWMTTSSAASNYTPENRAAAQAAVVKATEALRLAEVAYQQISKPEHVANVVMAVLLEKRSRLQAQLSEVSFQAVDAMQVRAFVKLQSLVRLVANQNYRRFLGEGGAIAVDANVATRVMTARRLFNQVLAAQVQLIFGDVNEKTVTDLEMKLRIETNRLANDYPRSFEVGDFARQARALVNNPRPNQNGPSVKPR